MKISHSPGSALIEVIVAVGLFALFAASFTRLSLSGYDGPEQSRQQLIATLLGQQGLESARSMARANFDSLIGGTHGIGTQSGTYAFSGTGNTIDRYVRQISVLPVYRDVQGNIISTGGTLDEDTKEITSTVSWNVTEGRPVSLRFWTLFTNWGRQAYTWTLDILADLEKGSINSTRLENNMDGEARLRTMGDILDPSIFFSVNTDRSGDVTDIFLDEIQDKIYISLQNDAQAAELMVYDVSNISNAQLSLTGSLELGDEAVGVVTDGDRYGFVITKATAEITVFDTLTMTIVASWDLPTGSDPTDLAIDTDTDRLYVTTLNSTSEEIYALDISNPSVGTAPIIGQGEIAEDTTAVSIYGGSYLFIGTYGATSELHIAPVSNVAAVTICDLPGTAAVTDITIVGTRLFIARSGGMEFTEYSINPGNPTNCSPTAVDSTNIGDTITDTYIDTRTNTAFLATGTTGYAVVDLSTFSSNILDLGFGCDATVFVHVYAIQGCSDNINTLNILRGGIGGWQNLSETGNADLPGATQILATQEVSGYLYVGTTLNGGGAEFFIYNVSAGVSNGMTPVGSLEVSANINDIFIMGNTAYLATSHDTRELMVINISNKASPSIDGFYNAQRTQDGLSVAADGSYVYLGTQNNSGNSGGSPRPELYVLNALVPTIITLVGQYNAATDVQDIAASGTSIILATNASSQEIVVLSVAIPAIPIFVTSLNLSGNDPALQLLFEGSTLYAVTQNNLYSVDATVPSSISVLHTIAISNPTSIAINSDRNLAFIGTTDTAAELNIINIGDPSNLTSLYSVNLAGNSAVYSIDSNTSHIFAGTNNGANECIIIGPGVSYPRLAYFGTYTSPVFDTALSSASLQEISWADSGSSSTILRLRTGNTANELLRARFVGSDGTPNSSYSIKTGQAITNDLLSTGTAFMQWKAYFSGSGAETPILEDVSILYK